MRMSEYGGMDMVKRLRILRNTLGLTQEEFGRRLGVTNAAICRLEAGGNHLTEQMIKSICREYHVRREWLLDGSGDMFRWEKDDLKERLDQVLQNQGDLARRVFRAFTEMSDEEWRALERFIDRLSGNGGA